MKKLLFITWSVSYGYGTEKSLADVPNRMDEREYAIDILPLFKYAESTIFRERIRLLEPLIDYTQKEFDEETALKRYYALLADPLQFNRRITEKYDCVIACNHNVPSYFASYLTAGAKVVWIRGDLRELDETRAEPGSDERRLIAQEHEMQANVFRQFDRIVVISDGVQKALRALFGITEKVKKITNSVNLEKIVLMSEEKVPLPDKMLFTSLGRLDYNKNQILLLKAAKELKKSAEISRYGFSETAPTAPCWKNSSQKINWKKT